MHVRQPSLALIPPVVRNKMKYPLAAVNGLAARCFSRAVLRRMVLVRHCASYNLQLEQTGLSMSHLIFLMKHRSQARYVDVSLSLSLSFSKTLRMTAFAKSTHPFDAAAAPRRLQLGLSSRSTWRREMSTVGSSRCGQRLRKEEVAYKLQPTTCLIQTGIVQQRHMVGFTDQVPML
jgi:hypothetical protein